MDTFPHQRFSSFVWVNSDHHRVPRAAWRFRARPLRAVRARAGEAQWSRCFSVSDREGSRRVGVFSGRDTGCFSPRSVGLGGLDLVDLRCRKGVDANRCVGGVGLRPCSHLDMSSSKVRFGFERPDGGACPVFWDVERMCRAGTELAEPLVDGKTSRTLGV